MKTELGKDDFVKVTKWERAAGLTVAGSRVISISQNSDFETSLLEPPTINWSAIGSVEIEIAEEMKDTLELAIKLATEWDEDTGKDVREVLKK